MSLRPGMSSVVTFRQDFTDVRYLSQLGSVSGLTQSYAVPGGAASMSCTLQKRSNYRTAAMNPGRILRIYRGGNITWEGTTDEPQPSDSGWQITAQGAGMFGSNYVATYSGAWSANPDSAVNDAISRGLRWINTGIGSPAGIWLGQQVDSGAQSITDLLNLACTRGGLTWYVLTEPRGNFLQVLPLPTTVGRLLVATGPVPRTIAGVVNRIVIRYVSAEDGSGGPAKYSNTSVTNQASVDAYGLSEAFLDLSSTGFMTAGDAQGVGQFALSQFQRASFGGPFTVRYGELLTAGGTPVDLGSESALMFCRLMLTDYGYGGEVIPGPITFLVAGYEYDDESCSATITPFQTIRTDFASLLQVAATYARKDIDPIFRHIIGGGGSGAAPGRGHIIGGGGSGAAPGR